MDEIYANAEYDKPVAPRPSPNRTGPSWSEKRFHGAVVFCLGLLSVFQLAGLIGLAVHCADLSAINGNLAERLQASYNMSSSLTEERDLLNTSFLERTEELNRLTADLSAIKANLTKHLQASDNISSTLTQERDLLNASLVEMYKDLNRLQSFLKQKPPCPAGWRLFRCTCYFLSTESASWEKGRQDCKTRGADLVVINSNEEQKFLSNFTTEKIMAWIGLTDIVKEGTWMWINEAPLSPQQYWRSGQPDNGGGHVNLGEEDCAHIIYGGKENNWNDLSCNTDIRWICEKMV